MTEEGTQLPALVETVVEQPMDFTVVARNPQEMAAAQRSMILWVARKIQAEKELLSDAQTNLNTARQNKWKWRSWNTRVIISEKRLAFYRKVKTALEAGYYIVPPFPIEVFALRTKDPRPKRHGTGWPFPAQVPMEEPTALPEGEGRYVSPVPKQGSFTKTVKNEVTEKYEPRVYHTPAWFDDVDFPFKLASPAVMSETARAMALKVFDSLGVLPATAPTAPTPDPMILGQILMPHRGGNARLTFFVAWWLDTRTL